jgi:S-formylglutathione hydrolase
MEKVATNRSFGGQQSVYRHLSEVTNCAMTFAVYTPPQAVHRPVPVLWYLSGLTCTHENAMVKAGAQAYAAKHGLMVIFPDTSPRGAEVADDDAYDLGQGAGFYVDATQAPWQPHFQMYSYITKELPALIAAHFPADMSRQGITGHSMGGHGALTIAMNHPETYTSVSAFAPIANPTGTAWGRKQLSAYLGDENTSWARHDACLLMDSAGWPRDMLVDQGSDDEFLDLLATPALTAAVQAAGIDATIRLQAGYDHSYFFVASFIADHLQWHADRLHVTAS